MDKSTRNIFEVEKLKYLKELRRFEVKREVKGFELKQIGQLIELQGSLAIYNLEKDETITEAEEAKLAHLNCLDQLKLVCGDEQCNGDIIQEGNILESLKSHSNLGELHIVGNEGLSVLEQQTVTTPESSANKAVIRQQQQTEAEEGLLLLPPQIQDVIITNCDDLNSLDGSGTAGGLHENNEVECFTKEQEEALQIVTSIWNLSIRDCEKLRSLPAAGISRLKALQIRDCPSISSLGSVSDSLQHLRISDSPAISSLGSLPDSLQQLYIYKYKCPAIHSLPKDVIPPSLREIDVSRSHSEELKRQCRKLQGTIP
ncbi:hypothetical protein ABZP36_033470, partial [Zizania latifolia]